MHRNVTHICPDILRLQGPGLMSVDFIQNLSSKHRSGPPYAGTGDLAASIGAISSCSSSPVSHLGFESLA